MKWVVAEASWWWSAINLLLAENGVKQKVLAERERRKIEDNRRERKIIRGNGKKRPEKMRG